MIAMTERNAALNILLEEPKILAMEESVAKRVSRSGSISSLWLLPEDTLHAVQKYLFAF